MTNEKRLIDANAFECVCVSGKSDDFCNGVLYVLDMIDAQPTVEAVPVVHGRWIRYEHGSGIYCLVCKRKRRYRDEHDNYCPHCGAKMDGRRE